MKDVIMKILCYDIYIRLLSGIIIAIRIGVGLFLYLKKLVVSFIEKRRSQNNEAIAAKNKTISIDVEEITELEARDPGDIAQKLMQQIEAESASQELVANKLEEQEREKELDPIQDSQKSETNANEVISQVYYSQEVIILAQDKPTSQEYIKTHTTTEVYNTKTNLEAINKHKARFELFKHEIEGIKSRGLRIEYEKKLVEATIDFADDEYFNTLLGDRYVESGDFKKAQTIYKKLHFINEFDDKALFKLGIINLELGDVQAAEYLLTRAKDLKPENPKYYQSLAEVKYNLEKIDECVQLMEKAVDLRPTKFEYIEILGKLYKETNNVQLYYKTLLKMNALEPMNQKVRSELGKLQD